jgi:hypothetical protein
MWRPREDVFVIRSKTIGRAIEGTSSLEVKFHMLGSIFALWCPSCKIAVAVTSLACDHAVKEVFQEHSDATVIINHVSCLPF